MPRWRDLSCECDRRGAAATANIDDPFAGLRAGAIDQEVGDRRQHDVLRLLPISPALAARSVPVRNLVGVFFVACRGVHVRELLLLPPSLFALRRDSLRAP